uniref:ECM29 ARM-like repeats domain-containing protein n=1 Tax=Timema shepardi TaxID=629360 RepID=A0A7R9B3K3_TIMSH|nr:unnamed protein product [Timema shepardi]
MCPQGFLSSPTEAVRELAALLYAFIIVHGLDAPQFEETLRELIAATVKSRSLETRHGHLLSLSHALERKIMLMKKFGTTDKLATWPLYKDATNAIVSQLSHQNAMMVAAACTGIGELARCAALPLVEGSISPTDGGTELGKLDLVRKLQEHTNKLTTKLYLLVIVSQLYLLVIVSQLYLLVIVSQLYLLVIVSQLYLLVIVSQLYLLVIVSQLYLLVIVSQLYLLVIVSQLYLLVIVSQLYLLVIVSQLYLLVIVSQLYLLVIVSQLYLLVIVSQLYLLVIVSQLYLLVIVSQLYLLVIVSQLYLLVIVSQLYLLVIVSQLYLLVIVSQLYLLVIVSQLYLLAKEGAALTLGLLCLGEVFPHRKEVMQGFLDTASEMTVGEALVCCIQGQSSPLARDVWTTSVTDWSPAPSPTMDADLAWLLGELLVLARRPQPNPRQAACIWIPVIPCNTTIDLSLPHHSQSFGESEGARDVYIVLPLWGYLIPTGLTEIVQDVASKGLALVYESSGEESQAELVRDLLEQLTSGRRAAVQVTGDTQLFEEGALGKSPTG